MVAAEMISFRKISIFAEILSIMGNLPRWEQKLQSYHKALNRLAEMVNEMDKRQLNDFEADGLIQRFEFTFELAWKTIKDYLEYNGIMENTGSPREVIKAAFKQGLIEDGEGWIEMMLSRNSLSHLYDENKSREIYDSIKAKYIFLLKDVINKL